jgi:hypothetical protein
MDRRTFLTGVLTATCLPQPAKGEDEVDRIIRRLRENGHGLIRFHVPEELFPEIERRSGIVILIN